MPGYDFQSPGSAATDAIQRYLLEQWKMQQASAAADLNKRNVESEISDREMNRQIQQKRAETEEEYRKAQEAELKAKAAKEGRDTSKGVTPGWMADYRQGLIPPGTDVTGTSVENIPGITKQVPNMIQARVGMPNPLEPQGGTPAGAEMAGHTALTRPTPDQAAADIMAKLQMEKGDKLTADDARKAFYDANRAGENIPLSLVEKLSKGVEDGKKAGEKVLIRTDKMRNKVEQFVNGQWQPVTGPIPAGAQVLTETPPSSTTVNLGGIGGSGFTQEGLDMAAKAFALTNQMPALGMTSKEARALIINRAAQYDRKTDSFGTGGGAPNLAENKATYAADTAAMKQAQEMLTAVEAFAGTAKDNTKLFDEVKGKVPDVGVSLVNAPIRSLARAFGSESMAQFDVARQSLQTEYARLVAMPRLTGQLTDSARHDIEVGLSATATVGQMEKAFKTLEREGENRRRNVKKQIEVLKKDIGGGSESIAAPNRIYYDAQGNPIQGK